ncbi:MAG: complex I NDUFA9 subunit family protein [Candidatus Puniceispirillaceae bacterium]
MMQNKTVTVIGGAGFIGHAVVAQLAKAGARVIILCRNAEKAKSLKPLGNVGQITAVAGDALDDAVLEKVIAPADMVVNLIGILAPSGKQSFQATQADLPHRIATMAKAHDVEKIVHLSAIGADLKSKSRYAATKAEGERALLRGFSPVTILRPSIVFGPGDGFFNRFGRMAMISPALPVIGGGTNLMQPVYVGDVAKAVMISLTDANTDNEIYELGGPSIYSFKELMKMTLAATSRKRALISVPFSLMHIPATFAQLLPNPPVTRDQLYLLEQDNVVAKGAKGFAELAIAPQAVEAHITDYLAHLRRGGRFASS